MWSLSALKDSLEVVLMPLALTLLAPWITRRWQDHERDTKIKTELVAEISKLVMKTVMTAYLSKTRPPIRGGEATNRNELETIYGEWRIETCVIGSKLHAYFPNDELCDQQIHKRWERFSQRVTEYYETKITDSSSGESQREDGLLDEKAEIIKAVLDSPITAFHGESRLTRAVRRFRNYLPNGRRA